MAPRRPWGTALLLPFLLAAVRSSAAAWPPPDACPVPTALEFVLRHPETCSKLDRRFGDPVGVIEGDEVTLAKAINLLHRNKDDYISVLFYASWCPFSQECKPSFEKLASLFPSIWHFAFEESAIRPSVISRYGIHGFPTLFLLNSTMRVRYHGPRTVKSLAAFYTDVSGINASMKSTAGEAMLHSFNDIEHRKDADPENCPFWWARSPEKIHSFNDIEHRKDADPENCPFWWARSPEKILQQDTYLALATAFVILRLLYLLYPKIDSVARWTWRRHGGVHGYFLTYLEQARQKFHRLYPSKRGNLQEGAMNATAWASKSLASVSIGESSAIGRTNSTSELR